MAFLATLGAGAEAVPLTGGVAISWWQTTGALVAVFGLLLLFLRLLGRFSGRNASREATLLAVWHLGPKREVQVLRLGQQAHYIYRHEGAMVLLKQEPLAEFEKTRSAPESGAEGPAWKRFLPSCFPMARNPEPGPLRDPS